MLCLEDNGSRLSSLGSGEKGKTYLVTLERKVIITTLHLRIAEKEEFKNWNAPLHRQFPCCTPRCSHEDSRLTGIRCHRSSRDNSSNGRLHLCVPKSCLTERQNENLIFFFFRKEIFVNIFKVLVQRECWGWIWLVKETGVLEYGIGEAISSGASLFCMIYSSSQKVSDDKLSSNWNSHLTRMTDFGGWELAHIVNSKEKFTYSELEFHSCICGQTINQRTAFIKFIGFIFSWKTCSFLTYCINQGSLTDSAIQPVPALGMISRFSALLVSGFGWFVCLCLVMVENKKKYKERPGDVVLL